MKIYKSILKIVNCLYNRKINYLYPCIMRVKILDNNQELTVNSPFEFVQKLWEDSFQKESTMVEFMLNYARRAVINNNENIRATSVNEFFEDLIKLKHIEIIHEIRLN